MRPDDPDASAEGDNEPPPLPDAAEPVPTPPELPKRGLDILNLDELRDEEDFDDEDDDDFDEDDEDEPIFDEDDDGVRSVLITGANGNIGKKLREAWAEVYDLVLIDKEPDPDDPDVIVADLSELHEEWFTHFHAVDTVIHLAANPDAAATWEDLEKPNIDALCNVFHAATLAGVERLIFASSNHAMGGYKAFPDMTITEDLPPKPDGPYGGAKLMGERLGRSLAKAYDITFIALRIGWVQPGENDPDDMPDDWSRALWLSNRDMVRLFECAVEAELGEEKFVVVNGMSNNSGMQWDITTTADLLEYSPEDDAFAEEL
jgi:NAD+ dependent glucose-6-phosphate dehydrogenase